MYCEDHRIVDISGFLQHITNQNLADSGKFTEYLNGIDLNVEQHLNDAEHFMLDEQDMSILNEMLENWDGRIPDISDHDDDDY